MPKKPLRLKNRSGLTQDQTLIFVDGVVLVGGWKPEKVFGSIENTRKAWEANKKFIMSLRGELRPGYKDVVYFEHGSRPWAFWKFDAPEKRRFLHYEELNFNADDVPAYQFRKVDFPTEHKIYESQFTYLKRLKLLLPGEEEKYIKQEERCQKKFTTTRN